jgi:putative membrane protein
MHLQRSLLATALLVTGAALAQSGGTSPTTPSTPSPSGNPALPPPVSSALGTTPSPEMVLAELHHANQTEVGLGKLAEQKASSKDVKKFAKHMVKAHTDLDKKAQSWAKKNKVTIAAPTPDAMAKDQQVKQRLQGLSGAEFDKAYMQLMAQDHAQDLEKVQTFEQQATDKSFKKLLTSARKEIAAHKRDADKLVQKLASTASR